MTSITVRFLDKDAGLHEQILAASKSARMDKSKWVRQAIEEKLARKSVGDSADEANRILCGQLQTLIATLEQQINAQSHLDSQKLIQDFMGKSIKQIQAIDLAIQSMQEISEANANRIALIEENFNRLVGAITSN